MEPKAEEEIAIFFPAVLNCLEMNTKTVPKRVLSINVSMVHEFLEDFCLSSVFEIVFHQ